jgi:origin recognition complex subunit 1
VSRGSSDVKTKNVKARHLKKDNVSQQETSESEMDNSEYDEPTESECNSVGTRLDSNASAEGEDSEDNSTAEPRTPSRKRKRKKENTPRNVRHNETFAQPTPHSKAALAKRQKAGPSSSPRKRIIEPSFGISFSTQSLTFKTSMAHLPKDPWLRAMHALHVGSRPDSLPCREEEFNKVLRCVGELLEEGSGGCVCKSIFIYSSTRLTRSHIFRYFGSPGNWKDCNSA